MKSLAAPLAAVAALASAALADRHALADEAKPDLPCVVGKDGVGFGFVFPSPGCKHTVTFDATLSAVSPGSGFEPRFGLESGYMAQLPGAPTFHLGPVFGLAGTDPFADENPDASVDLLVAARGRAWFGPSYPLMVLDLALGPTVVFPTTRGYADRAGAYMEAGFSLHGALGVFATVEPTWSVADGTFAFRYSIGVKTTAAGVLLIAALAACLNGGC